MAKTILIISGGPHAAEAALRAKELGYSTVVSDSDPEAPAFAHADSCLIADALGASETAAAAERYSRKIRRIDGVLCMAAEAALTAATVRDRLKLPGPSLAIAELAANRLAMKQRLSDAGVPVPWFQAIETPQALQRAAIERGRDLVIKPVESQGNAGVQRIANVEDLDRAFLMARQHSETNRVLAEQYLEGPQIVAQAMVIDGECHVIALADRASGEPERFAPFFVDSGFDLPSALPSEAQSKVNDVIARACAAIGLRSGMLRSTIVMHKDAPTIIALSPELVSGAFCTKAIPLGTGVDFIAAAIKLAVGDSVEADSLAPKQAACVMQRYVFPKPGRIAKIWGEGEARSMPGVAELRVIAKAGDRIQASGDKHPAAAMVLAKGGSHEAALNAAESSLSRIHIEVA